MKKPFVFLILFIGLPALAAELTMMDLTIPQFDVAGRMIRRLKADSATGSFEEPKLRDGVVEFFRPQDANPERLATLDFAEAIYHRLAGVIDGDNHIRVISPKGNLSGDGFQYQLTLGKLILRSTVVIELPTAHITGEKAEALISQSAADQDFTISQATVTGGVVVTGIKSEKFNFDRAETASAVYTASDGKLRLASPVVCWRASEKIVAGATEITIDVGNRPKQALGANDRL